MTALLLAVMLSASSFGDHYVGQELLGPGGGPMKGTLTFDDDIKLCFGDTTCDFWEVYNSTGTAFELWHDDVDGGGTPGVVRTCAKGGDDCTFNGALTISGGVNIDADNINLTLGAAGATDSKLYFDGTNVRLYSSGSFQFDSPITTGTLEAVADTGSMTWMNQEISSALADGTEVCNWLANDSSSTLAWCAESNGAGGIDEKSIQFKGFNGAIKKCTRAQTTLTFAANPGDASKTWTGAIPVGATNFYFTTRTLVAGTNCADADYGVGVADTNAYGDAIALTVGTTTNPADYTANINSNVITTAEDFVITGTDGAGGAANCYDLSVRVEAFYCTYSAPTE